MRALPILLAITALTVSAAEPRQTECIAPAKPGGGFDLTCKLAQSLFAESKLLAQPMRITYMPGGIGALAYKTIVSQRPSDPDALVAFSGGSLLNLAQGKFGHHTVDDVRWVATIGADYGVLAVRKDSPWTSMQDLERALKADPARVVFGAGGVVGSQDWGPKVSDADYDAWVRLFGKALATPEFKKMREQRGLYPFSATGIEAEAFAKSSAIGYRQLAREFGLLPP